MRTKVGFTILETALAMAFISFLMLAIGFAVIQISNIYQKGITIKVVNNNGRELVDEFSRTILASKYDLVEGTDGNDFEYTFIEHKKKLDGIGNRAENESTEKELQLNGAFCLGNYSYIWNTGYALNLPDDDDEAPSEENPNESKPYSIDKAYVVLGDNDAVRRDFRLVRVADAGHEACKSNIKDREGTPNKYTNKYTITKASVDDYVEILSPSESDLVLYDLTVFEPFYNTGTGHALYPISFILGTMTGGVDITIPGNFCTDKPNNLVTDFNYCSINKFNFAARATGGLAI